MKRYSVIRVVRTVERLVLRADSEEQAMEWAQAHPGDAWFTQDVIEREVVEVHPDQRGQA